MPTSAHTHHSASTPFPPRAQVHLPPRIASDFVIHYRDTDFHVHKWVLLHQSTYFHNYIHITTPAGKIVKDVVVVEGGKQRRVTTVSSEEVSSKCQHPAYVHCIHLTREFGGISVNEITFLLFLRHLYFATTFHLPPFLPHDGLVDSLSDDSPVCLDFPAGRHINRAAVFAYVNQPAAACSLPYNEALLSLFHYFLCRQAMQRSELVIVRGHLSNCEHAWFWLPIALHHKMKAVEDACVDMLGRDTEVGRRAGDKAFLDQLNRLPPAVIVRVMAAMTRHTR